MDVREKQRQRAKELMSRLSDSGYSPLMSMFGEHPAWLGVAVSQILAAAGEASIIYAGHTLEDYDIRSVAQGSEDGAEGRIQVLTEKLLVTAEFSAQRVKTRALPLRNAESVDITRISDARGNSIVWPDRLAFEVNISGTSFSFPVGSAASPQQYAELPAALEAILAAAS
jgi:hypothetical protein